MGDGEQPVRPAEDLKIWGDGSLSAPARPVVAPYPESSIRRWTLRVGRSTFLP